MRWLLRLFGRRSEARSPVLCDSCGADYTASPATGGVILGAFECCPRCAPEVIGAIARAGVFFGERRDCPIGVPFADFVRAYRREAE